MISNKNIRKRICLLGASFDTGNLGVSALAESSTKVILNRWPGAEVILLGAGRQPGEHRLELMGREIRLKKLPIRFCKNVFLSNHFFMLCLGAVMLKLLPQKRCSDFIFRVNPYVKMLNETDLVVDITGGDSFSDLYGLRRFFLGFLHKWLVILFGKKLVMLPQTYGPFNHSITKMLARYVLNYATIVYSRDKAGVRYVRHLLNETSSNGKVRFMPDVAFVLDSKEPGYVSVDFVEKTGTGDCIVVGLNISGLVFNGGYTRNNMFGLKINYQQTVYAIIDMLMENSKVIVLLVPHVFVSAGDVESDMDACLQVFSKVEDEYPDRIFMAEREYKHNEIKHVIGLTDFFIGSRMHCCIAAMSQGIATVGLAYSKKFRGVFESAGMEQFVADMRYNDRDEILATISRAFQKRHEISLRLNSVIPEIKRKVLNLLEDVT